MKRLKVATKIILSIAILLIMAAITSGVNLRSITKLTDDAIDMREHVTLPMDSMTRFGTAYSNVRSAMRDIGRYTEAEDNEKQKETLETNLDAVVEDMKNYVDSFDSADESNKEYAAAKSVYDALVTYREICLDKLIPAGMANDAETVYSTISDDLAPYGTAIRENIDYLTTTNYEKSIQSAEKAADDRRTAYIVNLSLLLFSILASGFLGAYVARQITKPLTVLAEFLRRAGHTGDITLTEGDERMIAQYEDLQDEVGVTIRDTERFIRNLADNVKTLEAIANGDLRVDCPTLSPQDVIGHSLRKMVDNLNSLFLETNKQITAKQREQIQNVIDLKDAYDDAMTEIENHVQSIIGTLSSNIADSMIDGFLAAGDAAAYLDDIVKNIGKNLAKSVIEKELFDKIFNAITPESQQKIDALEKKLEESSFFTRPIIQQKLNEAQENAQTLEDVLIEKFIAGDMEAVQAILDGIVKDAENMTPLMEQIAAAFGLVPGSGVTQSGKAGAFQTMSQDTGTKLEGLFTAMRMGQEEMNKKLDELGPGLAEATGVLIEIREEVKKSNGWLGKIYDKIEKVVRDGIKTR